MGGIGGFILGGIQLLAGIFLVATGVGSGIGARLILSGALSLIANAFQGKARGGLDSSPRYGFDNAQNTTREGQPIPVIFGRERFAPPIISVLFDTSGTTEILKYLCLVSEGEISAINDVRLNGSPAASLGATITTRLGTAGQTVIEGFERTGAAYTAGVHLARWTDCTPQPACGEYVFDMKGEADEVILRFVWPGGLFHKNSDGTTRYGTGVVSIMMKPFGAADTSYVSYQIATVNGVRQSGEWVSGTNVAWWALAKESVGVPVRASLRLVFDSNNPDGHPTRGRYTIRVRGENNNNANDTVEPDIVGWNEVQNAPPSGGYAYPNCALIGITLPASALVSGGIPRTDALVDGLLVQDFRTGEIAWSRNPVLHLYALLTNDRYGIGDQISASDIDAGVDGTFRECADRCDQLVTLPSGASEARYECDLVLDTLADGDEWFSQILSGCRMTLFGADGLLKLAEDRDRPNARLFDERMIEDAVLVPGEPQPPGENAWQLNDSLPLGMAQVTGAETAGDPTLVRTRSNIVADPESKISSLVVRQAEQSERFSAVLIKYVDRDQSFRVRTTVLRDYRLNVDASTITGGPLRLGEKIQGQTSHVEGWLTEEYADGSRLVTFVVAAGKSFAFLDGETVKGLTSLATFVASGSAYTLSPERRKDVQLFGVTRNSQAIREARFHLSTAQFRTLFASWAIARGDLDLLPGDVVTVFSTSLGWDLGKRFSLLSIAYDGLGRGRIEAREFSLAPYALVDRVSSSPFVTPGGALPPGLREPADSNPTPTQPGGGAGSPSAQTAAGGGGNLGTGYVTSSPSQSTALSK